MKAPRNRAAGRQQGFVLVLVLVLLVVLTLLAASVAMSGRQAVAEAQAEVDRFDGEVDMVSTRETLLYMLSVQLRTLGGLTVDGSRNEAIGRLRLGGDDEGEIMLPIGNEIRLDATPYRGVGHAHFALQDDRGLLNPNWSPALLKQRLYASLGAPVQDWASLDAKLLDYQDPDDLHRLGGAEKDDYLKAGLPPPTNRTLGSPLELRRVMGWDKVLADMSDEQILERLSMSNNQDININSAPAATLTLIPGIDPAVADRLIALRQQGPFLYQWQLGEFAPVPPLVSEEMVSVFPNQSGSLTLWDGRLGTRRLVHWTLTPYEQGGAPWRIDYEVTLPRGNQSDQPVARAPATPLFATKDTAGP